MLSALQERDASEESGWKLIHGDVFRPPPNLALLSAVVGTGAQLTMLVLLVILLAIIGMLYVGYVHHPILHSYLHSILPLVHWVVIPRVFNLPISLICQPDGGWQILSFTLVSAYRGVQYNMILPFRKSD